MVCVQHLRAPGSRLSFAGKHLGVSTAKKENRSLVKYNTSAYTTFLPITFPVFDKNHVC